MDMFCHGYQSWSETRWRTIGVDEDPSQTPGAIPLVRRMHDPEMPTMPGELRSELVTMFSGDTKVYAGPGVLWHLDGELHGATTTYDSLEAWAAAQPGRTDAPFQVGWCSWYHYFDKVTEADIRTNLALADDWPFDVFQIDDGYQSAIGDWLTTNDKFPSSLETLATDIARAGRRPGIWIAPFVAAPASQLATAHPDWFATRRDGGRVVGMVNDHWGGEVHVLDTTHPDVLTHLEQLAGDLVAMGFTYLKLDFTYAPGMPGAYAEPLPTPRERVRAGFEAIRRGAGDTAFLLGCGAPIGPCIGLVDGMRIGPDVAPYWHPPPGIPGYDATVPATLNAINATKARQFMHRRLWLNDPDCVMLRTTDTQLTPEQVQTWAFTVADSGGMVLVSDDLSLLGGDARALLDDVIARGREVDAQRIGSTSARTSVR
jgi:alpha-galactosidase